MNYLYLKFVVTLVLISVYAATIDDVSVVPKTTEIPTSVPRLLKCSKPSNVLVVATLLLPFYLLFPLLNFLFL